jgi:hypothetical protein
LLGTGDLYFTFRMLQYLTVRMGRQALWLVLVVCLLS